MIKLAIAGACGRMGSRLVAVAAGDRRFKVTAALDAAGHPKLGQDAGLLAGMGPIGLAVTDCLETPFDVLVDYSHPDGTLHWLEHCRQAKAPAVIGTTGHSETQMAEIRKAAEAVPVLKAPNMSVAMNLMFRLVRQVAEVLGDDYDIEIVEAHHRHKKDSPSGTAYGLLQSILDATGRSRDVVVHGRQGGDLQRPARQIGMHAIRLGDTVGEHSVCFGTMGETLVIRHEAHSRDTFARGALRAAEWLVGKKPGFYTMQDVLFGG